MTAELAAVNATHAPAPPLSCAWCSRGKGDWVFGAILSQRRIGAGLSQGALARQIGVTRSTVRNIELSKTLPARATLRRLCRVAELGLTCRSVLNESCLQGLFYLVERQRLNRTYPVPLD